MTENPTTHIFVIPNALKVVLDLRKQCESNLWSFRATIAASNDRCQKNVVFTPAPQYAFLVNSDTRRVCRRKELCASYARTMRAVL